MSIVSFFGVSAVYLGALISFASPRPGPDPINSWDRQKAAAYLDERIEWWMTWPAAARGQGTFCVSCHTAVPYLLARPALRQALSEAGVSAKENRLLDSVTKRVHLAAAAVPFYTDQAADPNRTARARGTEAVLNALILASYDARKATLSDDTRVALKNMWVLQQITGDFRGSWWWLQFGNEPFEAHDSQYYGAALAAVAVGIAPQNYRSTPAIQKNLSLLCDYLNREYEGQSPINQVVLLWASAKWPGLIPPERRQSIIDEIVRGQQKDGGWNLASLAWTWRDWNLHSVLTLFARSYGTPLSGKSDGYATALIAYALQQAGSRHDDLTVRRALSWLARNQDQRQGFWTSYSLNNRRDPSSPTGRFMTDAATAYAVLALSDAH